MQKVKPNVILCVPTFNEIHRLDVEKFRKLLNHNSSLKIVFADDGSNDGTNQLLEELSKESSRIYSIYNPQNLGKANTIRRAFATCLESSVFETRVGLDWIGFTDADRQISLGDIQRIIDLTEEVDRGGEGLIDGIFAVRAEHFNTNRVRNWIGHLVYKILHVGFSSSLPKDTQCGLKVFKISSDFSKIIDSDSPPTRTRWFFEWELYLRQLAIGSEQRIKVMSLQSLGESEDSKLGLRNALSVLIEVVRVKHLQFFVKKQNYF